MHTTLQEGGAVFVATAIAGVVAACVFVERLVVLHRTRIRFSDFLSGVFNILSKGKIREALAICDETPGPVSKLVHCAIMHKDDAPEALREAITNAGNIEVARMERRLRVISTIMHAAPLLGLLGGALGAIRFVRTIQVSGQLVQTLDLTSGLVTALLCFSGGLAVSIVSFVMFNIVAVRIDRIILDMEQAASNVMAFIPTIPPDARDARPKGRGAAQ